MSEIDKALQVLTANQKMIDRMTKNLFTPLISQQNKLIDACFLRMQSNFYDSFSNQYKIPPEILSGLDQYAKLSRAIASSLDGYKTTARMVDAFTSPMEKLCKDMSVFSQQEFQSAIKPLISSINNIRIFPNYVEAPEVLTSDKLLEATPEVLSQPLLEKKKLTCSEVAWLATFLLALLSWLFPDPLSNFQENTDTETFSITHEQGEQIIECLVSLTEYLENHPDETNDVISNPPVLDLSPSNSQLDTATPDSAIQSNLEADSKLDNTESNSEVE